MIRATTYLLGLLLAPFIILLASPLLLWFGRSQVVPPGEMVVDAALDDDPGTDVDEGSL